MQVQMAQRFNQIRGVKGRLFGLVMMGLLWGIAATGPAALASAKLVVISPHRKSIQQEFVTAFREYYQKTFKTDVDVEWLDQGGTSDDLRFIKARFSATGKSAGVDVFWGGGTAAYMDLDQEGFLAAYKLPAELRAQVPSETSGVPLVSPQETWQASGMSSFGIFINKRVMAFEGLKEPKLWQDLADPSYFGQIALADPRRSGSSNTMNNIVLQSLGFDRGFAVLTALGGNARAFAHSSSDPIKSVVSGDTALAMAIDFYATAKVNDLGKDNLSLVLPVGQTVLDPDPVAILKGAPNRLVAERFVAFLLSKEAQKLWILPKKAPGGPKTAVLGRFAVNKASYDETKGQWLVPVNPFASHDFFPYDAAKASKLQQVLNDLVGATIIDSHELLKKAWRKISKDGATAAELAQIGKSPVTEAELLALADKWDDNVFRNKVINEWVSFARKKYQSALAL